MHSRVSARLLKSTILLLAVLSTVSMGVSASPLQTDECMGVGLSDDPTSSSLFALRSYSHIVGNSIVIFTDCDDLTLTIDGSTISVENGSSFPIGYGLHNITLSSGDTNMTYSEVYFYTSYYNFTQSIHYIDLHQSVEDSTKMDKDQAFWDTMLAHFATFVIIFFMTTSVIYRIAVRHVDLDVDVII